MESGCHFGVTYLQVDRFPSWSVTFRDTRWESDLLISVFGNLFERGSQIGYLHMFPIYKMPCMEFIGYWWSLTTAVVYVVFTLHLHFAVVEIIELITFLSENSHCMIWLSI